MFDNCLLFFQKFGSMIEHLFELIAAVVAAFAAMWAARQAYRSANAANESVRLTEKNMQEEVKTAHLEARAYLTLTGAKDSKVEPGASIATVFELKNVGNTPAYNTKFGCVVGFSRTIPTQEKINAGMLIMPGLGEIAPSSEFSVKCFTDDTNKPVQIDLQAMPDLNTGRLQLYCCGKVTYDDAFGDHHITRFGRHYYPDEHTFNSAPYYNSMS